MSCLKLTSVKYSNHHFPYLMIQVKIVDKSAWCEKLVLCESALLRWLWLMKKDLIQLIQVTKIFFRRRKRAEGTIVCYHHYWAAQDMPSYKFSSLLSATSGHFYIHVRALLLFIEFSPKVLHVSTKHVFPFQRGKLQIAFSFCSIRFNATHTFLEV